MAEKTNGRRAAKRIRNVAIAIVVLLLLLVAAGIAYTYYSGSQPAQFKTLDQITPKKVQTQAPTAEDPNTPTSAAVTSFTTPVTPGSNTLLSVQTNPGAVCTISVVYNNTPSTDSGLQAKQADQYGTLNWSWTVESSVPIGKWPVTITCTRNKKEAVVATTLEVAKTVDDSTGE